MMGESHWEFALPLAWTKFATVLHLNSLNFQTTILLLMMPFEHYLAVSNIQLILNNTKSKLVLRKLLRHAGFDFNILLVWLVIIVLLGSKGEAIGWKTQL